MDILIIENQPAYNIGLLAILKGAFTLNNITSETSLTKGIKRLESTENLFDVIFIGINNTDTNLLEQLESSIISGPTPPIIVLSSVEPSGEARLLECSLISAVIPKNTQQNSMLNKIKFVLKNNNKNPNSSNNSSVRVVSHDNSPTNKKRILRSKAINLGQRSDDSPFENFCFDFNVSADEEHTFLSVEHNQKLFDFGERVHHYLLLLLARRRSEDCQLGYDEASQGWVEISDLQDMLGLDYCHLNIQIFRARQQINRKLSSDKNLVEILERRVGSIRFTGSICHVFRAGKLESAYQIGNYRTLDYAKAI